MDMDGARAQNRDTCVHIIRAEEGNEGDEGAPELSSKIN